LYCHPNIPSPLPPQHFIQIGVAVELLPYQMRVFLYFWMRTRSPSGKSLLDTGFPRVKGYFPGHAKHPRVAYDALCSFPTFLLEKFCIPVLIQMFEGLPH
jgi:hypothetical protein